MGGVKSTVQNLKVIFFKFSNFQVYKIDAIKNLIFIKGSIPGKRGTVVKVSDAIKAFSKNEEFLNYPTFIPEEGKQYADELIMDPPEDDPMEDFLHDNDVVD